MVPGNGFKLNVTTIPFLPEAVAAKTAGPLGRLITSTAIEAGPMPAPFTARNRIDADTKFVNPLIVIGEVVPTASVQEPLPTLYWYLVIDAPPSEPAVNAIEAEPVPEVATRPVGADGVVRGVTDTADDFAPPPTLLYARSLMLYDVPFVRPVMETGELVPTTVSDQEPPSSVVY